MCGLVGYLAAEGVRPAIVTSIEAALPLMRHRGPDDAGVWHDSDAVIGFRRLSLIDWEHSHQPLPYLALSVLERHRRGEGDYSRRIWALLVFAIWHGIFVEERIHPMVPEPRYPVSV
jgi:hypothetical protein